ncbi:hypothetical protein H2198_003281 [Neophaeococcomyces mojaviensis]|uniref:Uncharacterized protein n=1 Tax=Neophaeococcomyces mojaviensis TaxID=3383035 RepID=A0ACC3ABR0_9EURO|nr:hypothetical protein H2198_003281 [Knufia sp. JES_112]
MSGDTEDRMNTSQEQNTNKSPTVKRKGAKTDTGHLSEHGHSLEKIKPMAKHSGQSVVTFFNGLFQTIIAIATLGTSVTFSFILSSQTELSNPAAYYSQATVATFLSISWLLFLLALAFASLGSTLLTFFRAHWVHDWDGEHGRRSQFQVQMYAVLASGLMGVLIIGAFIMLCLVVVAYAPIVGWIALAFTGWFGLVIVLSVCWQVPWPWRDNTPDGRTNSS